MAILIAEILLKHCSYYMIVDHCLGNSSAKRFTLWCLTSKRSQNPPLNNSNKDTKYYNLCYPYKSRSGIILIYELCILGITF